VGAALSPKEGFHDKYFFLARQKPGQQRPSQEILAQGARFELA
jgi:hypothetical protein